MAVRYIKATIGLGESSTMPEKIGEENGMLQFRTKVIDLPGPTRNGVLYPVEEMRIALNREKLLQQLATGTLYGEYNHPDDPTDIKRWADIDMSKTSFKWKELTLEGNSIYGVVQTVPINDDLLRKCILAGEFPSFSIRVLGEMEPSESKLYVQLKNIHLITIDWVRYPGNPDSFVKDASSFTVMESPFLTGKYEYSLKAQGESLLLEKGLLNKGEEIVSLNENGLFAVAESIDESKYKDMKKLRANSFL